ncbi:TRAP transporter fused permease subunit [Enterocloster asparagiformis]|uniref:TRAP transporter permease n=1 Tax=Enterocloster asparagiformis TaxID=333367 RepID=UPI002A80313C|nr:TRAP transporter fused permease subunit [Enterocloster asparagiformis]
MKTEKPDMKKYLNYLITVLSAVLCLFHLYAVYRGTLSIMRQKVVHIGLILLLAVLVYFVKKLEKGERIHPIDVAVNALFFGGVIYAATYIFIMDKQLVFFQGAPNKEIILAGLILTAALFFITQRTLGWVMPLIAITALAYGLFGDRIPGALGHRTYSIARISSSLILGEDGIMGTPLGVSAGTVAMFVIFGSVLQYTGAGQAFIDLAFAAFGTIRGGPAKVAVVSSALFGSISGSPIANVVSTGTFTIPLMKKVGYEPEYAGAVEAVASTGGQIMPPIMGAAAFIMAQSMGVPYMTIVRAAILPAFLYYFMVLISIHLVAVKGGMKGLPASQLPDFKATLKKSWFLILPIGVLVYMLVVLRLSTNKAALYCCGLSLVASWFSRENRVTPRAAIGIFLDAAQNMISVALACAIAGVVISMLSLTGLGLKLSSLMIMLSGENLYILMFLVAVSGIILGMGLPSVGVYVILAALTAPALVSFGVSQLSAQFYVFYFGCISAITPPVALAAYAAAGIAGCDTNKTGWLAVKLGLAGFLLPVLFVLNPSILMTGSPATILQTAVTSTIAITVLTMAVNGVPYPRKASRAVLILSSFLLLDGGTISDLVGLGAAAAVFAIETILKKRGGQP